MRLSKCDNKTHHVQQLEPSSAAIALPFKPTLEWHIHGIYENLNNGPMQQEDPLAIQNCAAGEFVSLVEVDGATQHRIYMSVSRTIWELPVDENGRLMKLGCNIDIVDITRRLLTSAVENCDTSVSINDQLIGCIAHKLALAIVSPFEEDDERIEPIIFSLVPAIAMERNTGKILAYAVGQLVARGPNNSQMLMAVRGCALDAQSRQVIIESISQSLLPVSETSI